MESNQIVLTISANTDSDGVPISVQMETGGDAVNGHDAFVAMFAGMGIVSEEVIHAAISRSFPDVDDATKSAWYEALVLPISEGVGATYASINETLNMILDVISRSDADVVNGLVDAIMTGYEVEETNNDGDSEPGE